MVPCRVAVLSPEQLVDYRRDGYVILRNVLSAGEAAALRRIVQEQVRSDPFPPHLRYPESAKYTVAGNRIAAPGLAAIASHPTVVEGAEQLLGSPAHLAAFVAYLRSAGDEGGPSHCDYRRWRPVGSSMNWLFAVIPLQPFDDQYGPLLVSPGSHRLMRVVDEGAHVLDLTAPDPNQLATYVDADLDTGDLLLMNGRTWHKAPPALIADDRCSVFHKYCAVDAPPAAGHYPYSQAAFDAVSDDGKRLLACHGDLPLVWTRVLIESVLNGEHRYLVVPGGEADAGECTDRGSTDPSIDHWQLPGGCGWEEQQGVGWDLGARIGSLQSLVADQLDIELPWASYITDWEGTRGLTRVYGYLGDQLHAGSLGDRAWPSESELEERLGPDHDICASIRLWRRSDIIRGIGKAVNQSKSQFG